MPQPPAAVSPPEDASAEPPLSAEAAAVVLAAAVPVLALRMFFLAARGRFEAHRRLGRITLPIWLYVSVTGVVIYLMLYRIWPTEAASAVASGI